MLPAPAVKSGERHQCSRESLLGTHHGVIYTCFLGIGGVVVVVGILHRGVQRGTIRWFSVISLGKQMNKESSTLLPNSTTLAGVEQFTQPSITGVGLVRKTKEKPEAMIRRAF